MTEPAKTLKKVFKKDEWRPRERYTFREWLFTSLFLFAIILFSMLVKQLLAS